MDVPVTFVAIIGNAELQERSGQMLFFDSYRVPVLSPKRIRNDIAGSAELMRSYKSIAIGPEWIIATDSLQHLHRFGMQRDILLFAGGAVGEIYRLRKCGVRN